ncbi:aldehyde dehydrogenase DhaS [soil metagenome]
MNTSTNRAAAEVRRFLAEPQRMYIDGSWLPARSGRCFTITNPSTGTELATAAEGDADDVDLAVAAARRAFRHGEWPGMPAPERARLLWRLGDLIDAHADELALIEALDVGKPIGPARRNDIAESAERFRYFAGWVNKITGDSQDYFGTQARHAYTLREPVGVAGLITAWNFPLFQAANKLAPALAAGCCVVLKPPELAPLSTIRLAQLAEMAGFPKGVINIVTGLGHVAGSAMTTHAGIDKISFTGSTATGRKVLDAAQGNFKRVTLELGGKSPTFVFADADLDKTIPAIANGVFYNAGQICTAGTRLYVEASIFDQVLDGVARHAASLEAGPASDPATTLGPLASQAQRERVERYVSGAREEGALVHSGGQRIAGPGYHFEPTILVGCRRDSKAMTQEIFGPVLCAEPLHATALDEVADIANDTDYGLAAYIWTRDLTRAHALSARIKAGLIVVNGGARDASISNGGYKQSGWGREHGFAAVESYTELKSVVMGL